MQILAFLSAFFVVSLQQTFMLFAMEDILIYLLLFLLIVLPGLLFWFVEWLIWHKRGNHVYIAYIYPYLFLTVFLLLYFVPRAVLHNVYDIQTLGSVRQVPLEQQPWKMRLMNYDMRHACIVHPDGNFVEGVTDVCEENDSILLFSIGGYSDSDEAVEQIRFGKIQADNPEIVFFSDSVSFSRDALVGVDKYYKDRLSDLTAGWKICFFFFAVLSGIMMCVLLHLLMHRQRISKG